MEQSLKKNVRAFIWRGDEIKKEALNRVDGIYAVSRRVEGQDAPEWGIVSFNEESGVVRSYNVTMKGKWDCGLICMDHLRFYEAAKMERDFANLRSAEVRYRYEYDQAAKRLMRYTESRWHRVAEALRKFFSF